MSGRPIRTCYAEKGPLRCPSTAQHARSQPAARGSRTPSRAVACCLNELQLARTELFKTELNMRVSLATVHPVCNLSAVCLRYSKPGGSTILSGLLLLLLHCFADTTYHTNTCTAPHLACCFATANCDCHNCQQPAQPGCHDHKVLPQQLLDRDPPDTIHVLAR